MTLTRFLLKTAGVFFVGTLTLAYIANTLSVWILVIGLNLGIWIGIPIGGLYECKRLKEMLFND